MNTKTPCIGECTATAFGDEICRGCGRTFEEVRDWNTYDDATKDLINANLKDAKANSKPLNKTRKSHIYNCQICGDVLEFDCQTNAYCNGFGTHPAMKMQLFELKTLD